MNITKIITPIKLLAGSHADTGSTGQGCFMNVIAYLNGEPQITDQSECVCVTVRSMAIFLNDLANNEQRQRMVPLIMRAMGSATDDKTEISRRLALLVEFAQGQAELAAEYTESTYAARFAAEDAAESAKCSAKYSKYAEDAAMSTYAARFAAEDAAESAKCSAKYVESVEYAEDAVMHAEYAIMSAMSAMYVMYVMSNASTKYHTYQAVTFSRGLILLDAMLPALGEVDTTVFARAQKLSALTETVE